MKSDLKNIAIVIWRIVGVITIFNGVAAFFFQLAAVDSTFGQIMDRESLYTGSVVYSLLIWPTVSVIFGFIAILKSRFLADLLIRGLVDTKR